MRSSQFRPDSDHGIARIHIVTGRTNVLVDSCRCGHDDGVALGRTFGVFNHDNRVGPGGNRSASHDSNCAAGFNWRIRTRHAGTNCSRHTKSDRNNLSIDSDDGVSVNGSICEWWNLFSCDNSLRSNATQSVVQRDNNVIIRKTSGKDVLTSFTKFDHRSRVSTRSMRKARNSGPKSSRSIASSTVARR